MAEELRACEWTELGISDGCVEGRGPGSKALVVQGVGCVEGRWCGGIGRVGINRWLLLGSTVGSCWDRPSAFAEIDRQLLPSALAGIDRNLQGELC
jgi:hypothetical protein